MGKPAILLATSNPHKLREVKEMVGRCLELFYLPDFSLSSPEETGGSLEENARIKAVYAFERTGMPSLGEDTGIFVRALGWAPGVYSARFSGGDDRENREKLLYLLRGERDRYAEFRTALVFYDGEEFRTFTGKLPGYITAQEMGDGGFGYDPIFLPLGHDRTLAQMKPEEKNAISHRKRALMEFLKWFLKESRL